MHISCTFAHVRIRADLFKMPTSLNEPALLLTDAAYLHLPSSLFASALIFPLALHFPPSEDFNSPELILLTK